MVIAALLCLFIWRVGVNVVLICISPNLNEYMTWSGNCLDQKLNQFTLNRRKRASKRQMAEMAMGESWATEEQVTAFDPADSVDTRGARKTRELNRIQAAIQDLITVLRRFEYHRFRFG